MVNEKANVHVTLNNQEAQQKLEELQGEMKRLIDLKKKAEEAGDVEGYKLIDKELKKVNRSAKSLVNEHRDLEATLKNLNGVSLKDLETAKRTLLNRIKNLKQGTQEWKKEAGNLSRVTSQIGKVKTQMGLLQSPMQKALSFAKGLLPAFSFGVVLAGMTRFVRKMNEAAKVADDFNERLDNLSALTGLEGRELDELGDIAKKTSVKITEGGVRIKQSADDIVDAYTKVGSQRPELLKNGEALASVTEDAIILSEAAKSDLAPAVAGLTTTMNQFNIGAEGSKRIINAMAAGSKEGAADIPYLTEAVEKSGTTMHLMNISLEENIGLIETIAPNYAKASLAGNSLDKVFLKLKEKQIGYKNGVFSVNAALEELEVRYKNGESAASIFGVEHAKMGELLVQNKDEFNRYTTAVTGTNVAIEQAVKNTSNNKAIQAQARNEYHLAAIELGNNLSPAMTRLYQIGGKVVSAFSDMIAASPLESLKKEQEEVNALTVEYTDLNTPTARRYKILEQLKTINPKIVEGLDAENVNVVRLKDNMKLYNDELVNRMVLANLEEEEQAAAANVARAKTKLLTEQYELSQLIAKVNPDIALGAGTLEEKAKKIQDILKETGNTRFYGDGAVNEDKINLVGIGNALANILDYQNQINDAEGAQLDFTTRMQAMKELLGLTPTTDPAIGSLKTVGNTVYEWDGKTWNFKENIGGSGSVPFVEITEEEVFDYAAIDAEMAAEAYRFAVKAHNEGEWTDFLTKQIEERTAAEARALEIEKEVAAARMELKDLQVDAIGQLATTMAGMFQQGSAAQIAMIAIEKAIAIAHIWMNLAREKSAINLAAAQMSTIPIVGPGLAAAYSATMTSKALAAAKINTGLIVASTIASGISSGKRQKKQAYAQGKYFDREQTGIYNGPHMALFGEVPGQPEMVIDGLTTRNININYPEIMDAIYAVRDGNAPRFADGKYPTAANDVAGTTESDNANKQLLAANHAVMQRLLETEWKISVEEYETKKRNFDKMNQNMHM